MGISRSAPVLSSSEDREDYAVESLYDGTIEIPNILKTSALVMDDVIKNSKKVGNTDSVASADELMTERRQHPTGKKIGS